MAISFYLTQYPAIAIDRNSGSHESEELAPGFSISSVSQISAQTAAVCCSVLGEAKEDRVQLRLHPTSSLWEPEAHEEIL